MALKIDDNFRLLFLLNALAAFTWFMARFFLGPYLHELGFSGGEIGFFFALSSIAALIFIVPAGLGNDHFSSKLLIRLSALLLVFVSIGFVFGRSFGAIALLFFCLGLLIFSLRMSIGTNILKQAKEEKSGSTFGWYHFFGCLGVGLGMILGGFLWEKYDFSRIFWVQAAGFLLIYFLAGRLIKTASIKIDLVQHFADIWQKRVALFIAVIFFFTLHWGAEEVAYGLFLQKNLGLNNLQMGLYMMGELLFLGLSSLYFGLMLEKNHFHFRKIFFYGLFLSGITQILMTVPTVALSAAIRMVHGVGDGAMNIVMFYGIRRLFQVEKIGGSNSIITLAGILGSFVGALIFGHLGEVYGFQIPFIISGIISISLVALAWFFHI